MGGKNLSISKKIFLLFFLFCIFSFNIYSQNNSSENNNQSESILLSPQTDDANSEDIPFQITQSDENEENTQGPSTFWLFFRMIIVLAFVIACIYGVMWLMKRSMKKNPKSTDPFLRDVSSIDLAVGKSVHVVTLLDHAYIVGVSENSVSKISELDSANEKDKELINAMNLYADEHQNVKKPKTFADILEIFMPKGPKDKSGVFGDSQKKMNESMENQRSKLNGGE